MVVESPVSVRNAIVPELLDQQVAEETRRFAEANGLRRLVQRLLLVMEGELYFRVNVTGSYCTRGFRSRIRCEEFEGNVSAEMAVLGSSG